MTRYPALASLLLGALAATGFAPLDWWPVALASFAGWIALVFFAPTVKSALWRGWLFGVGHFTINDNWFQHAFDFQDKMPPVLGYAAPIALALYLAIYPAMAAGVAWRLRGPRIDSAYLLVFGAAWIATEWLRATMFTGYAWDPLGVIWVPVAGVARLSAWIGTYALSGLTVVAAGALVLAVQRRYVLPTISAVVLVLAAFSAPFTRAPDAAPGAPRVHVAQPNVGQDATGLYDPEVMLARLARQSGRPGPTPRLLLWPEGVLRDYLEDGYPPDYYGIDPYYQRLRLARLLGPRDVLLAGGDALQFGPHGKLRSATNSVYALDAHARLIGRYDKAHLVPYGEYLPMRSLLEPLGLDRIVPGEMDFTDGPGPRNLLVPGIGPVGIQVCYEIVFSGEVVDRAHRPRFLFNPSNDAWFGRWGPPQHLAQARMRAMEEGLPIVRATPTGISAVIAADGRLLATVPHEHEGSIEVPLPPALPPTLFARVGNSMAVLVALALLAGAVAIRRHRS